MAFKYSTDGDKDTIKYEISSFRPTSVFNDEEHATDAIRLFKVLLEDEVGYHSQVGLVLVNKYTTDLIEQGLRARDRIYFVRTSEGKRIGMATTQKTGYTDTLTISAVVIDKKYRGKGIGKKLMEHVINDNAGQQFVLTVSAANQHATELYKSLGFSVSDYKMIKKNG